jgi:hypothetical protein
MVEVCISGTGPTSMRSVSLRRNGGRSQTKVMTPHPSNGLGSFHARAASVREHERSMVAAHDGDYLGAPSDLRVEAGDAN